LSDVALPTNEWLAGKNNLFRAAMMPPSQRPYEAWRLLSAEAGVRLESRDPAVARIFQWFEANTKPGSGTVGPLFEGTYFYDGSFWPMVVPLLVGTVRIEPAEGLRGMPPSILAALMDDTDARDDFINHWGNTVDYTLSVETVHQTRSAHAATEFLFAGDRELRGASRLLLEPHPTAKGGQSAALGLEMVAKWFLCLKSGRTAQQLKDGFDHRISDVLAASRGYLPGGALDRFAPHIPMLPKTADRYRSHEPATRELWAHYRTAIGVSATLLREETGVDVLGSGIS
jgi:hypothetical protein